MNTIHLIYALTFLAYGAARSKDPASTKAGVIVTPPGVGTIGTVMELAAPMGMNVHVIHMANLVDDGHDVRTVRKEVEEALAPGKPTIFVLADAEAAQGDMLMRVTRVIDVANTTTQAVIMAVGQGVSPDRLAMDVADGMQTSRDRIMGSSLFEEAMKEMFDRT